ncbi:MAG TPA: hypothetical protein VNI84_11760, partial [Pyrinomonadaceae bacterium]|nr:hypothetical protein [Pyrinomonadaceae bacterium]
MNNENSAAAGDGGKNHAAIGDQTESAADAPGVIRTNGESFSGETNGADRKSIGGEGRIGINLAADSLQSGAETSAIASENPHQTPEAQTEDLKVKLRVSDYAALKAQIIVRQAELADLKFDEAQFNRDTRIKRFDVLIEPSYGENVSKAAAPKTIDRIEFLRLASTGEPLASLKADERDTAKWSMTDINSAREVITDTRDFIKAEKNSRDENKWRSQQNLKNLFESHFSPLKMAENHLNTLTPDGLANHLKVQANPLAAIENHPIVQVIRSVREMKTAGAQAALLNRIDDELNQKLYTLNTHITNEVVDRIEEARDAGKSARSQKQKEIDELKELTKDAPDTVNLDFTARELEKISVSALRSGDRQLMFEYQKAVVENAKRLEADKLRFSEKYNEMYKKDRVDKFSARAMRELENTPVTEKQAAALVEKGGKYPKNMLDALHQIAEIKGEDYAKNLADAHRAAGRRDFPPVETFDRIDVLAHADGQKLVADLRAGELESEFERRFAL